MTFSIWEVLLPIATTGSLIYSAPMLYLGCCLNVAFLAAASNDNEDLLDFATPAANLSLIREIKSELREDNARTGVLLRSRKNRRYFEEVVDAERYLLLRYFSCHTPQALLDRLKRRILDRYLFPRARKRRVKSGS